MEDLRLLYFKVYFRFDRVDLLNNSGFIQHDFHRKKSAGKGLFNIIKPKKI
jgi:hypothetical protein